MQKYYPGLRDILPSPSGRAYYLDKTTLLYKYFHFYYYQVKWIDFESFNLFPNITILSVPDEGYSRNARTKLYIYAFNNIT